MSTYITVYNDKNKAIIDDNYRYLYKIGVLNLNFSTAQNPAFIDFDFQVGWDFGYRIMNLQSVDKWYYMDGSWLEYSTYPQGIVYCCVVLVNKNNLYGIRFKQPTSSPKYFVRCCQSAIGSMIAKDKNLASLFIVIYSNTKDSSPQDALNYFEIVEIGNDKYTMPQCTTGIEVYNANGEAIWNSNCKMADVKASFVGNIAGTYTYNNFGTSKIVVTGRNYKYSNWRYDSSGFRIYSSQDMDFWSVENGVLKNTVLDIQGYRGYHGYVRGEPVHIWEIRDFGSDSNTKFIEGLICE